MKHRLKANPFLFGIITLTVINLWIVDFKIIEPRPKASETSYFRPDGAVNYLQADTSLYRILPVDNRPANWYAYHFIQSIYGYHAAKLKIYQEVLEEAGMPNATTGFLLKYLKQTTQDGRQTMALRSPGEIDQEQWRFHQNVLRMLNVKYIVTPYVFSDSSYQMVFNGNRNSNNVFEHRSVLPRAFFVNQVKKVLNKEELFSICKREDFDPAHQALMYKDIPNVVTNNQENSVDILDWDLHSMTLHVKALQPGFLVLSETFYPAGWQAKLNEKNIEIYQTNHILRGVFVPEGEHTLLFEFKPTRFWLGFWITMVLLAGCTIIALYVYWLRKNTRLEK